MTKRWPVALWLAACAVLALVVARAHYSADLSAFLPATPTAAQAMLVDQIREGPASRLILIAIEGADAPVRAQLSARLASRLRSDARFRAVLNGDASTTGADRAFVFTHRYMLSERITSEFFEPERFKAALAEGVDLLASPLGLMGREFFTRDPSAETLQVMAQFDRRSRPRVMHGVWVSPEGERALLVAHTEATGADTDGQQAAMRSIEAAFESARAESSQAASTAVLHLTGPGVFGVEARTQIEQEAARLSVLSTVLIAGFLLAVYRSPRALILGMLPVLSGALAGVAAVAIGFEVVHAVTLGFGVTLIGEAVDYSVYLFIQREDSPDRGDIGERDIGERDNPAMQGTPDGRVASMKPGDADAGWQRRFWPTIRLGMLTSAVGFASLVPSGFPGLAQLGVYSIAGLVAALLVTRHVLPALLPPHLKLAPIEPVGEAVLAARAWLSGRQRAEARLSGLHSRDLRVAGWRLAGWGVAAWRVGGWRSAAWRLAGWTVPLVALGLIALHRAPLWDGQLSSLSPVPAASIALDSALRRDLGAPEVRSVVVASAASAEDALVGAETAAAILDPLVAAGVLAGYDSPARYLPSEQRQQAHKASIPPRERLQRLLDGAAATLPIRAEQLSRFVDDLESARTAPLITRADLESTSLRSAVELLLVEHDGRWNALMPLAAPRAGGAVDTERVSEALTRRTAATGRAAGPFELRVLDLKTESDALYAGYLAEASRLSLIGLVAIMVLLAVALRSMRAMLRVVMPLLVSVMIVMAGFSLAGHPMNILHLVGLLLIVAIGSNYALFFERETQRGEPPIEARTVASLVVANLTTVIGFGVLALSSVPVLAAIGSTVAPGAFLALVLSALMSGGRVGGIPR